MVCLLLPLLAVLPFPDRSAGEDLYERVSRASAEILLNGRQVGSGWFAAPEGLIVTVAHALWGREGKIEAVAAGGDRKAVEILAFDRGHDLALLRFPRGDRPFPFLEAAPAVPEAGTPVFLFGAAFFRHGLMLAGHVARPEPGYEYYPDEKCCARVYYVAGPSPKGTSGGCWVDARGRVVGTQSGLMTPPGGPAGVAFVSPPEAALRLVRERSSAATADLGLVVEEPEEQGADFLKKRPSAREGVVVVAVPPGPSEAAGIRKHSLVLAVGGNAVRRRDDFYREVRRRRPGEEITLKVLSPDSPGPAELTLKTVRLEEPPAGPARR